MSRTGRLGRLAAATAAGAALLLATAAPASAHNQLESTLPADGAGLDAPPASVVLTFDQPVLALGTQVVVLGPDGAVVSAGEPRLVDDDVTQDLAGALPAGGYRVEWRATSADGHPVSGELGFTASGPGTGAVAATGAASTGPAPEPSTTAAAPAAAVPSREPSASGAEQDGGGGSSTAAALALAAVAAVAAAVTVLVRRRRTGPPRGRRGGGGPGSEQR